MMDCDEKKFIYKAAREYHNYLSCRVCKDKNKIPFLTMRVNQETLIIEGLAEYKRMINGKMTSLPSLLCLDPHDP